MSLAVRLPAPVLALDAKRIAATSLAIAVHAAVLLMLMMPMQVAEPPKVEDTALQAIIVRTPPPPPPPPPVEQPRRAVEQVAQTPPRTPPTHVEVINDTPSPVDPYVPEVTLEEPPAVPDLDTGPRFVELRADVAPPPGYPSQALRLQQQGQVLLRVLVDEAGRPVEVAVEASSGFRVLDEAALKVVRKRWHFVPATRDGTPVQAWALVPVSFVLE